MRYTILFIVAFTACNPNKGYNDAKSNFYRCADSCYKYIMLTESDYARYMPIAKRYQDSIEHYKLQIFQNSTK